MRSRIFASGLLVAGLLLNGAFADNGHPLPEARPESVGMSSERLERIGARMQWYIDQKLVPGTVTLVARKGKVVHYEARGQRWVEQNQPMTEDSIFRIASMTKPITSVALMMLFEEGQFQLNDPISKWLPEFTNMQVAVPTEGSPDGVPYRLVPADKPITVEHVLTHTAGFANSYRNAITMPMEAKASARQSDTETVADYVKRLAALPLNYQPGTKWEYSRATCVVGRLVEVMSGMTLDEFFRTHIFQPLGMHDTYFYLPTDKLDRLVANYKPEGDDNHIVLAEAPDENSAFVKEPHLYFMGSGGLVSTAADYWRFHQMMLNGGELNGVRILSPKTVELMTANHTRDLPIWLRGPGTGFGLGYSVTTDIGEANSMASVGTFGWGGAFCTYFWVDPVEDVVGIVMTQVRPYTHINIRQDFQNLAMQAIVE